MGKPRKPPDRQTRATAATGGSGKRRAKRPKPLSAKQKTALEARNGLLQFDYMVELVRRALQEDTARFRLRPSVLLQLHKIATQGVQADAGQFRTGPVQIGGTTHKPPASDQVLPLVEDLCDDLRERWHKATPVHLAALTMWRVNWIHPFSDGNGRTARVVAYMVLCIRLGFELPGDHTIPQQIAANKFPYYDALDAADAAWKEEREDVSKMEELLGKQLAAQLMQVYRGATGTDPEAVYTDQEQDSDPSAKPAVGDSTAPSPTPGSKSGPA